MAMCPASWIKKATPLFQKNTSGQAYGVGHNSFVKSPDGRQDWIVYHAFQYSNGGWANRSIRAQAFDWAADGLGPSDRRAFGLTGRWQLSHRVVEHRRHASSDIRRAGFGSMPRCNRRKMPGLADPYLVSFEAVNYPGYYLQHRDSAVWVEHSDSSAVFKSDATRRKRQGLAHGDRVSFESDGFPGRYLLHADYPLYLDDLSSDLDFKNAALLEH